MMVVTRFLPTSLSPLSLGLPASCVLSLMTVPTTNLSPSAHLEVIDNRPSRVISPSMLNKGDAISLCKRTMHEKSQTLPIPILCSHISDRAPTIRDECSRYVRLHVGSMRWNLVIRHLSQDFEQAYSSTCGYWRPSELGVARLRVLWSIISQ